MIAMRWLVLALLAIPCGALLAADRNLADSLAVTGAQLAAKGNTAQAKDILYKALANDEDCPDALYEMAKLLDKEGNGQTAGDLYQRAALLMAQENKPASSAKRADAELRLKALNPIATKLNALLEEYARDLDKLVKKFPDNLTAEAASTDVSEMKLATLLPPDKLPKFSAASKPAASATTAAIVPASGTTPEVERELKSLGWTTISGSWIKKSPGVFESTDGKLEAKKTNGTVDFFVLKGGSGSVKAAVRNGFADKNFLDLTLTGYGVLFKGKECKLYAPNEQLMKFFNGSLDPTVIRTDPLPDAAPKHHAIISVSEGNLDFNINDKRKSFSNSKLPRAGPFVLEVTGTMTLENPRCTGQ